MAETKNILLVEFEVMSSAPNLTITPVTRWDGQVIAVNYATDLISMIGNFLPIAIIDGIAVPIDVKTSRTSVHMRVLHFEQYAKLDPSYSVLINSNEDNSATGVPIGIVVGSSIGAFALATVIACAIYLPRYLSRRQQSIRLKRKLTWMTLQNTADSSAGA